MTGQSNKPPLIERFFQRIMDRWSTDQVEALRYLEAVVSGLDSVTAEGLLGRLPLPLAQQGRAALAAGAKPRPKRERPPPALSVSVRDHEAQVRGNAVVKVRRIGQNAANRPPETDINYVRSMALRSGPLPMTDIISAAFWSGYRHEPFRDRGLKGSIERCAYDAGWDRATAEPGWKVVKHQDKPLDKTMLSEVEWIKANGYGY